MNKQVYLNELRQRLSANNVEDIEEIIAEYDEHFVRKMADGYTQEEIASKLGAPKEIALQFVSVGVKSDGKKAGRILVGTGLVFADIFIISFFIVLFAWVLVTAVAAATSVIYGLGLFIRPLLPENLIILPSMPYLGGFILGVTILAFGVLMGILTVYCWALTIQLGKAYRRWHKNMMSDGKYPPLAKYPMLKDVMRRKLRSISLIALITFGVSFIIGYIVLAGSAGSLEFWHVWHWFV